MDTQNTPVHIKLWHCDFWRLCFANLLLMTSVCMLFLAVPNFMFWQGYDAWHVASVMGVYGLGIFAFGAFCSYLVQSFRRNRVCQYAILGVVVCLTLLYGLEEFFFYRPEYWMLLVGRFCLGACIGLAQMTLGSTLVIDTCESFQRTEANYIASWFARFALALGPVLAIWIISVWNVKVVFLLAGALALVSLLLVSRARFPFKAPEEHVRLFSLDRFFLPQGMPLFLNVAVIMMVVGIVISIPHSLCYYLMMLFGLGMGVLAEKYVFPDADLKSEVVTGLLLLGCVLLLSNSGQETASVFIAPTFLGVSVGIMGSRFLLFYIKLAKHCQRGTSMSSFFLAWEFGLNVGISFGFYQLGYCSQLKELVEATPILDELHPALQYLGLGMTLLSLLAYNFFVHPWYMKHRNR